MKTLLLAGILLLGACSAITPKLNESTGTTLAQRCADYKAFVASLRLLPPSEDRTTRINFYEALIVTYCAGQPE